MLYDGIVISMMYSMCRCCDVFMLTMATQNPKPNTSEVDPEQEIDGMMMDVG